MDNQVIESNTIKNRAMNRNLLILIGLGIIALILIAGSAAALILLNNKGEEENSDDVEVTITPTETIEITATPSASVTTTITSIPTPTNSKTSPTPTPGNAISQARNTERQSDITQIANGIMIFITDGNSISDLGTIPACETTKAIGTAAGNINLAAKLVPDYLSEVPQDPTNGNAANTGYTICQTSDGRIKITAPYAELGKTISITR